MKLSKNVHIEYLDNSIIINSRYFDVFHTFTCGQTFRYEKNDNDFFCIAGSKAAIFKQIENGVRVKGVSKQDFENFWLDYLDLTNDYKKINERLEKIDTLKPILSLCSGLRILKQPLFETLISFIISANNNIPRIMKAIKGLSQRYGQKHELEDKIYYSFPTVESLAQADVAEIKSFGTGYRAEYIVKTAMMVAHNNNCLKKAMKYSDNELKEFLLNFKGVGPKVSDCVMLFAYSRWKTFPTDTWIKNTASKYFIQEKDEKVEEFTKRLIEEIGNDAGYAQQLIFHSERNKNNIEEYHTKK